MTYSALKKLALARNRSIVNTPRATLVATAASRRGSSRNARAAATDPSAAGAACAALIGVCHGRFVIRRDESCGGN